MKYGECVHAQNLASCSKCNRPQGAAAEFTSGYMAGYWGRDVKDNASQEWLDAYGRGEKLREIEREIENG